MFVVDGKRKKKRKQKKKDVVEKRRRILVTSALARATKRPNLGDIVESVLSADVFGRYCRMRGYQVLFVGGTDDSIIINDPEDTQEQKDAHLTKFHNLHKKVYDWFDISFDVFGGTSSPEHNQLRQQLFNTLSQTGLPPQATLDQVLHAGLDVPLGYVSITQSHAATEWEQWWKNPQNVQLHQFVGHNTLHQHVHTVLFPLLLMGTRQNWSLPSSINATKSCSYETGREIFGDRLKRTGLHADVWRYYLMSIRPEVFDSIFTCDDLAIKLNNKLTDQIGKFIDGVLATVATPPEKGYGSIVPDISGADIEELDVNFGATIGALVQEYIGALEKARLKEGLEAAMKIAQAGLEYFHGEKVWPLRKKNRLRRSFVVKTLVGVVYILARLLEPFMPTFSAKVLNQLDLPVGTVFLTDDIVRTCKPWEIIPSGHKIGKPVRMLLHLSTEFFESLKRKFSVSHGSFLKKRARMPSHSLEKLERGTETSLKRCSMLEQCETGKKDSVSNQLGTDPTIGPVEPRLKRCSKVDQHVSSKEDLKKCPDVHQCETSKVDYVPNQSDTDGTAVPSGGTTLRTVKKRKTYFQKMDEKYAKRRIRKVLSPRAASLYRSGMEVRQIREVLGTRNAFTNWRDASSIQVEMDRTGQHVLGVFGHGRRQMRN